MALGELRSHRRAFDVPVAELPAGNEKVRLTPQASADLDDVVLSWPQGHPAPPRRRGDQISGQGRSAAGESVLSRRWAGIIVKAQPPGGFGRRAEGGSSPWNQGPGLSLVAYRLWGVSMTEKRDAEVEKRPTAAMTARSRQAVRGHLTPGAGRRESHQHSAGDPY